MRRLDLAQDEHSDWPDVSNAALLARLDDWLLPYLRTTAIYVGLAVIVHVGIAQAVRLARPHGRRAG